MGITREGKILLGRWIAETREGKGFKQYEFAEALSTVIPGVTVSSAMLGRIERGDGRYMPGVDIITAIARSGYLKLPDGSLATVDDLMDVALGVLDPFTGERKEATNGV